MKLRFKASPIKPRSRELGTLVMDSSEMIKFAKQDSVDNDEIDGPEDTAVGLRSSSPSFCDVS